MCVAQVLECPYYQSLEHFLCAHVFALNMIQSSYDLQSGCPGFRSGGFYPPPCFVKFIGFTLAVSTGFKKGSMYLMEGIRFHLCASPLFHACAEGLVVADEFHVPLSFRLAAAIVPRRRERSARHQFSPLGTASYVQKPEPQCHIRCPPSTVNKQPSSVSHQPSAVRTDIRHRNESRNRCGRPTGRV